MKLISEWCQKQGVQVWAYCLIPKHVHRIEALERKEKLPLTLSEKNLETNFLFIKVFP